MFWTKRSGRRAYSGPAMRAARLLSDAALGGMVLLSAATLERLRPLPNERLPPGTLLWHSGRCGRMSTGRQEPCSSLVQCNSSQPSATGCWQASYATFMARAPERWGGLALCVA